MGACARRIASVTSVADTFGYRRAPRRTRCLAHALPARTPNPNQASRLAAMAEAAQKQALWGAETEKAIANFPVSGEPIPVPVARWLGRIKSAAARVNADLELLDRDLADRIAAAADRVAAGEFDDQFPIDVFQTGSGTSSNTNANEVIAALAGGDVHPNDHVNMGQSSNDVFPSAVHLAALAEIAGDLLPALELLAASLERKADQFDDVVKSGRTHLMDAVPVTLGQEFGGYAAQVRQGIARVRDATPRLGEIPLGGTATGTGLNTHPEFAARVRRLLSDETGLVITAPVDHFEAQAARDGLVEASGALKVVAVSLTKIANDLRLMGSGPRAGLSEIFLPELQKGSSIMPGKVNPVIPEVVTQVAAQVIGNDTAITVGGLGGHFELNVYIPLMARNLLDSIELLASASRLLAEKCVDGIEANRDRCEQYAESTLSAATALNPYIGYDKATEIVNEAVASGRPLREVAREAGVDESILDEALDYRAMAKPHD
jgi:fumarate hydratase, class II